MTEARITMYGTPWCGDCLRARRYLDTNNVSYTYIDIVSDPEAASIVEQINGGNRSVPTIIFPDGTTLTEPSNVQLEQKLGAT